MRKPLERQSKKPDLAESLRVDARALGFDACRILRADEARDQSAALAAFLADGGEGDMSWLRETAERRAHPRALWPDARSIIMLGMNYGPDENPNALLANRTCAAISVYARNRDYHDLIKGRLKLLAQKLLARAKASGASGDVKVFVDTAPLMEKPLAMRAGLGWQGKHTNLVSREFGSWLFLGAILTTLDLPADESEIDHCGACRACLDACPTSALPRPYVIDARRCISYLTIEHKGPIPRALRKAVGNRIYGCDDCLAACPWNKFAQKAREARLQARDDLRAPPLADLAAMDDTQFRAHFAGNPIKRIGRARFLRNVLTAIGASGAPHLAPAASAHLASADPLVRGASVWALSQLLPAADFAALKARSAPDERDASVLDEWRAA